MPTSLFKNLLPTLQPIIHKIVNKSLTEKKMPTAFKKAIVKPLRKKPSLDKEDFKNYRLVSNLAFLGKVIEKAAIQQINQHISNNNLHEPLQSAYTKNHSTETALLKVPWTMEKASTWSSSTLVQHLTQLTTLFFCSSCQRTMECLHGGMAEWMQSYLSNHHQSISINGTCNEPIGEVCMFPGRIPE